jgi:hypothetical protein
MTVDTGINPGVGVWPGHVSVTSPAMTKTVRLLIASLCAVVVFGGLMFAYLESRNSRDQETTAEESLAAPSLVTRDQDGAPMLKLDPAVQQRLGIQTAAPVAGFVVRTVTGIARVLDGSTLAGQLNDIRATQTALETARLDYERKKRLFDNGQIASAAAVETAEALVKQSQIALEGAHDRLTAAWGTQIARREDLLSLARSLLSREAALVRVELSATTKLEATPALVQLLRQDGEALLTARVLGAALTVDSVVAGQAFLALAVTNAGSLVPNSSLVARLETGQRDSGVVLPRAAVVRHRGQGWVYVETARQSFTRCPAPLDHPHPEGWLVPGPWTQRIIVSGAQSLLSEELKGSIQMSD